MNPPRSLAGNGILMDSTAIYGFLIEKYGFRGSCFTVEIDSSWDRRDSSGCGNHGLVLSPLRADAICYDTAGGRVGNNV